jgi:hypothetical protein
VDLRWLLRARLGCEQCDEQQKGQEHAGSNA